MRFVAGFTRRAALACVLAAAALGALEGGGALAADTAPAGAALDIAPQAAPDEGGTGVNNFKREEWFEFSVLLAPFIVLVTFILILTFMWDRSTGNED